MALDFIDRIRGMYSRVSDHATDMSEALMVIEPVPPFGNRGLLTVLVTTASLISIALLGSMGLAAMVMLLIALGLILLILANVFGIDFDLDQSEIFRYATRPS